MRSIKARAGFTIIEIMLSTAIFAIITTVVAVLYSTGVFAIQRNSAKADMQGRARQAMTRITALIQDAAPPPPAYTYAVDCPAAGTNNTICGFYSADDLLSPNPTAYQPRGYPTSAGLPGPYHYFRLQQAYDNTAKIYNIELIEINRLGTLPALPANTNPRVLFRGAQVLFRRDSNAANNVWVNVTVRSERKDTDSPSVRTAQNRKETLTYTLGSSVGIPTFAK